MTKGSLHETAYRPRTPRGISAWEEPRKGIRDITPPDFSQPVAVNLKPKTEWQVFRDAIRLKDNFTCHKCGKHGKLVDMKAQRCICGSCL